MSLHRMALLLVMILGVVRCYGQDINDRFAEYQLQLAQTTEEGMSVMVEKLSIIDQIEVIESKAEGEPAEFSREVTSRRKLQRVIFGPDSLEKRLDAVGFLLLGQSDLLDAWKEAELVHQNQGWYFAESRHAPTKGIQPVEIKGGVIPTVSDSRWQHPFVVATSHASGVRRDLAHGIANGTFNTLEETLLKDGRTQIIASNDNGGVYRFVFNQEEEWFAEEIDFLRKDLTREEEIAIEKRAFARLPQLKVKVTKDMLKDYRIYATNRTVWKKLDNNQWVPWVVRLSTDRKDEYIEDEIRFREWKFGDDVDLELLEEESFTPEKIRASIDFKAVRDLFDESK